MALRNEDFRKLLASTPARVPDTPSRTNQTPSHSFNHKAKPKFKAPQSKAPFKPKKDKTEEDEEAARLKEILKNYRDRAAERRDKGDNDESDEMAKLAAAYQAVPGNARDSRDKAHARRQAIEESKFLGGDIEHTHLVKGLDYSLLHKVRSEIHRFNPKEDQEDLEKAYKETEEPEEVSIQPTAAESKMVRSIQQILFKNELPLRNDLFKKGRMAYVVEMEDENEAEVPTTLLRSLIDCPNNESNSNINANNMLISKLTQVLSYLRADHKKKKRPEMEGEEAAKYQNQSIFDNEAEYVPRREKEKKSEEKEKDRDREKKKPSYFDDDGRDKNRDRDRRDRDYDRRDRDRERKRDDYDRRDRDRDKEKDRERQKEHEQEKKEKEQMEKEKRLEEKMEKRRKEMEGGGYDECYPGGFAEMGGTWGDSDDEDFTKMDMGNKKSGIKRWDFENEDEYEKFQGGREAMPKAAFQYGLKPQDGRKTRKNEAATNKKLDRELVQIEKINEKRKAAKEGGSEYKKPKY